MDTEATLEFEELHIRLDDTFEEGIMLYGTAKLVSDGAGGFFVDEITLTGGSVLRQRNFGTVAPDRFKDEMFKRITDVIMDGRTDIGKAAEWAWDGAMQGRAENRAYNAMEEERA